MLPVVSEIQTLRQKQPGLDPAGGIVNESRELLALFLGDRGAKILNLDETLDLPSNQSRIQKLNSSSEFVFTPLFPRLCSHIEA